MGEEGAMGQHHDREQQIEGSLRGWKKELKTLKEFAKLP